MTKDKKVTEKPVAEKRTMALVNSGSKVRDMSKNKYRCENCKTEIVGADIQKHNLKHKGQVIHYTLLH